MNLPQSYLAQMKEVFGEEYDDFVASYEQKPYKGISLNTKKISVDDFINIEKQEKREEYKKVQWSDGSLYVENEDIAKNVLYHTGAYYVQEPSASSVVNYLDIHKGMRVLDMCASPGGKTFQISQKLADDDLLVSNDINNSRMPQLIRNIEYYGLSNVMITNENQENLAKNFPLFFDRILLDSPCSGEGMFRKDKKLIASYEKSRNELVPIQRDILEKASTMLKVGGKLMYSTCTFNKDENENNILDFLEKHKEFRLVNIEKKYGMTSFEELKESARFLPHKLKAEGHFLCLMEKIADDRQELAYQEKKYLGRRELPKEYIKFEEEFLNIKIDGNFFMQNDSLYLEVFGQILPHKTRIVRNGLYLGYIKNGAFVISSAFIRHLRYDDIKCKLDLDEDAMKKYIKGETLIIDDVKDKDYIVCIKKLSVGLVRAKNGKLKNLYNKNWRMV